MPITCPVFSMMTTAHQGGGDVARWPQSRLLPCHQESQRGRTSPPLQRPGCPSRSAKHPQLYRGVAIGSPQEVKRSLHNGEAAIDPKLETAGKLLLACPQSPMGMEWVGVGRTGRKPIWPPQSIGLATFWPGNGPAG